MANDLRIINTGGNLINTDISHWYVLCDENQKIELLRTLVQIIKPERAIVFAHRNDRAEQVSTILSSHNCSVADIHSARDKFSRKKALDSFRAGDTHILIASDVMARGLDINGVSHVFNIDPPSQSKAYLHRAGRTGRAGAHGQAVSILSTDELHLLKSYQRDLNISISQAHIQNGKIVKDSPLNS